MDQDDKLHEACGVFGIYAPDLDVARVSFFGLYALQHRGQESAGIAVSNGDRLISHKEMGLVSQVFTEESLAPLQGHIAIGHTRYSTTGSTRIENSQPFLAQSPIGEVAVAHNGNLTNSLELAGELRQRRIAMRSSSDSEVITLWLAHDTAPTWEERIARFMNVAQGSYSLVVLTRDRLMAVRDPWGIRPLCLGELNGWWVVASESCALNTVGATFAREVEPGEIVTIQGHDRSSRTGKFSARRALCIFEFIYFARPDSALNGINVASARQEMGRQLAQEHPAEADLVIGVPDSATAAAIGYAQESGIPYGEGLIKNRYIGRTFIQPDQRLREVGIRLKFNALRENLAGKRVVVVDDSIVRGNTTRPIVDLLRRSGAREVHVRISAPPMAHPCFLGVDTATYEELIAHRLTVPEIGAYIGADSLGYLSLERLLAAVQQSSERMCSGCFTSNYPVQINRGLAKLTFEQVSQP